MIEAAIQISVALIVRGEIDKKQCICKIAIGYAEAERRAL